VCILQEFLERYRCKNNLRTNPSCDNHFSNCDKKTILATIMRAAYQSRLVQLPAQRLAQLKLAQLALAQQTPTQQ
jgi:hypothetical protein